MSRKDSASYDSSSQYSDSDESSSVAASVMSEQMRQVREHLQKNNVGLMMKSASTKSLLGDVGQTASNIVSGALLFVSF
jgi:hypothetical protein